MARTNEFKDLVHASKPRWCLVDRLEGIVPIGCKWILKKKKINVDGKIDTFNARLMSKGYH